MNSTPFIARTEYCNDLFVHRSSSIAATLSELDEKLHNIEERYKAVLSTTSQGQLIPSSIPLSQTPSFRSTPTSPPHDYHTITPAPVLVTAESRLKESSRSESVRKRHTHSEYLAARLKEDAQGGEVGLLPLRPISSWNQDTRAELLGPGGAGAMGSAQLQEELGGQLADVRHISKLRLVIR